MSSERLLDDLQLRLVPAPSGPHLLPGRGGEVKLASTTASSQVENKNECPARPITTHPTPTQQLHPPRCLSRILAPAISATRFSNPSKLRLVPAPSRPHLLPYRGYSKSRTHTALGPYGRSVPRSTGRC